MAGRDESNADAPPAAPAAPAAGEETIEAVQAVLRAAVDVGRQLLDAVERALDDPATADRLAEVVGGFGALLDGLRRPGTAGHGPSGTRSAGSGDVEHIELS
jgi:hypothetical protein